MPGRILSHYQIIDEISRGGMGVVYRAVDVKLGREVALKVLPEELLHDPTRRERLVQEARAASALEHPNIAVIHEVGDADGVTFIAMELIRGEKLSETLGRGPLPQTRAFALATEVAEGLARAHEKGIIHRDLKPANVIVTEDGHAKIIDFGLAKVVEPAGADGATVSIDGPQTDAGVVMGTAAYMSPEQARGERVDHRTDIFAVGVTLFEMITGRPAFQGRSAIDTMQAILSQPVPPLPAGAGSSAEATAELQRIIVKATEKEADDRYQGMKDLIVDLRSARRRLESSQTMAVPSPRLEPVAGRRMRAVLFAGTALVIIGATMFLWWRSREQPGVIASGKPAVAVLHFENNTGDASLDWMRSGLTDMIVTDLSQSTEFEVLGTDRLVQILQEINRVDDRVISADVVKEIASRAGVDNVLVGSYVRAGDKIRISARLQDAQSGRILGAERVDGSAGSGLFGVVDELTRRFRSRMSELTAGVGGSLLTRPGETTERGLDRGVTEITTSSIEAYRYYADAINFHERGLYAQAVPLLEKAIEIDPDFAMAHAKLAVVNGNLGLLVERDQHVERALALIDRLNSRERHYIEGFYYTRRPETRARGIEAYEQGLALHPEHQASRHNLALHLMELERFPEAIQQYEELLRRGTSNPTSYDNLAEAYAAVGDLRRASQIASDFARRHPEMAVAARLQASTLQLEGRLDEARAAFDKALALNPLDLVAQVGRRNVAILQGKWAEADAVSEELGKSSNPFQRYVGLFGQAVSAGGRGRGRSMLEIADRASALDGIAPQQRAAARSRIATILLRWGQPAVALTRAEQAVRDGEGSEAQSDALRVLAVAQAAVGRAKDAATTLARLEILATTLQSAPVQRRVHWARGEIALIDRNTTTGVAELVKAAEMLPAYGPLVGPPSPHADLWLAAGLGLMTAGRESDAAKLFERLQSGHERAFSMEAYVRSLFLLAQIEERRGNSARARELYAKFLEHWQDGDLERAWVAEAKRKIT